jgi:uncharacterized protein
LKLHASSSAFLNTFTGYGDDYIEINERRFTNSLIVRPEGEIENWPVKRLADLTAKNFDQLLNALPELVIFGSGKTLRFVHPRLYANLTARQIGLETMDVGAACRTYNILMSEGRKVACAILIEPPENRP